MTPQQEAEMILKELKAKHGDTSPWLSFDQKNPKCPKKIAGQKYIKMINDRILRRPELLDCMMQVEQCYPFYPDNRTPFFIVLQQWIQQKYAYIDKSYARQLWDWLQGPVPIVPDVATSDYCVKNYADYMAQLFIYYDLLKLDYFEVDKFIAAVERQLPNSAAVLACFAQKVIDQHFEEVFWRARRSETLQTILLERNRMANFINEMRIKGLVTDTTTANFTDYYSGRDYEPGIEYKERAIEYFTTQTLLNGYEELKHTTIELINRKSVDPSKQPTSKRRKVASLNY